ncbi:MAG: asparagine synthase (glutamine-hydrolyzing) [Planctomycetota bacterium]|nr:asparagine synthase (glutamine-hydrolyzing) [Planctomycetota bacterium]MDA1178608.1 asparagine synthase (glutamine-hydrolyzing) [Planctomycetota bacterium]
MCGIAGGIWWDAQDALEIHTLRQMTNSIRHRGPDGAGEYYQAMSADRSAGIALGHRRLAIIDIAEGAQPMSNEDGTVLVLLNGEIYNYQELRMSLQSRGHTMRTRSDTEVIVHLYEEMGIECLAQLEGMFAIALWDDRKQQLFLARDRLGEKPLWYRRDRQRLAFGSELKSLLQIPGVPREIDPLAIDEFLTLQYIPAPRTIFRGFHKLPPGHFLVANNKAHSTHSYWNVPVPGASPTETPRDLTEKIKKILPESVRFCMQSEVPLGAFLSGGVDSSLVVALMQQHSSDRIKTFSIGFDEQSFDERPFARQVAMHFGTEHHEILVRADTMAILPQMAAHFDEPFGDSSALPTWCLAMETRREVTVALTGDGSDELFCGYDRYRAAQWATWFDRIPAAVKRQFALDRWPLVPGSDGQPTFTRKVLRLLETAQLTPAQRYLVLVGICRDHQRRSLYEPGFALQLGKGVGGATILEAWERASKSDVAATAAYTDLCTYLPGDLLTKVDMASMAHSLECRQPFLNHKLVEVASQLPSRLKTNAWRGKLVLRKIFGNLLPDAIWNRRKMGFGIPINMWFRGPLREITEDLLISPGAQIHTFLRPAAIQSMWQDHQNKKSNHGYRLWCLLVLESWLRHWSKS